MTLSICGRHRGGPPPTLQATQSLGLPTHHAGPTPSKQFGGALIYAPGKLPRSWAVCAWPHTWITSSFHVHILTQIRASLI